jgi:2-polyprenyl-3-methyl-5-hydroxy-6-metoxy-1,4-benzoquinol methylase
MVDGVERVRAHFDAIGDAEWDRMIATPRDRVSFELHRRLLADYVRPGDRVLEVGAGPGRFTIELARLGARVTVTDISPVQLELNERHVRDAGCDHAVGRRLVQDVREVGAFGSRAFDVVVAFGGPLSYVFEEADDAFHALVFVTRPEGHLLASVMSSVGSFRYFLPLALEEAERFGGEVYDHVLATGDLRAIPSSHTCQMYRWSEVEALVAGARGGIVAASASNCMSLADPDVVAAIEADPERWRWFLDWEARMCREPGALDGGTHILFAFRRDPEPGPSRREARRPG